MKKCIKSSLLLLFVSSLLSAQIRLPAIIGDNMVLQQRSSAVIWGWAQPGEEIRIQASWLHKPLVVTAGEDGKWQGTLKTAKAGGPYTIRFSASDTIDVKNVMLGEVWLASGQSNMEFFVGKATGWRTGTTNYEAVIATANHPDIRMIDVENKVADTEQTDFNGKWTVCSPQTVADFSAVAYFFAKEIELSTGYPIGIINSTWGGTPAESWTKKQVLENNPDFQPILARYDQQVRDYPEASGKYTAAYQKWKADNNDTKAQAPKKPADPSLNSKSPCKLYNGMIAPLIPYTLKGVIWYQGESNAVRGYQYRTLFPAMINSWRQDWHSPRLPFYFVQISPHRSQNPDIRESQLVTYHTTPYTGIVVTTDNGDSLDIHPRNKELVGKRLSLWALHNQYGKKKIEVSGPLYKSMKIEDGRIRIKFDYAKGLRPQNSSLTEFTIAGSDQVFVPARASIEGNTVVVWSDEIKDPVAVRFAWRNIPRADLYNGAGLPASPFRTDNWKIATEGIN